MTKRPAQEACTIIFAASVFLFVLLAGCGSKPNVLLIAVDTLRTDRLSCYGWGEKTTPNIDRLASEGVLLESMTCPVPQTLPSFCSMLTGNYPITHGVRVNGIFSLPVGADTLAESFRDRGYRTGAFIAGFPLDSMFGLSQGFDIYSDEMRSRRPLGKARNDGADPIEWLGYSRHCFENVAEIVTDDALAWLESEKDGPFFMMVHYFDPHDGYAPPERFRDRFSHPYAGEVAYVDEQVGRLLDRLDGLGLAKDTLVVFTADHGECLGEQNRFYHQGWLVDATLHVPFLARMPGRLPAGKRIEGLGRTVDILPTILELAEIAPPDGIDGASLAPAFESGRVEGRIGYFETLYGKLELGNSVTRRGITDNRWKLIHNMRENPDTGGIEEVFQLFDVPNDREQLHDLAPAMPEKVEEMRARLDRFLREHPAGRADILTPGESTMEKLKDLGYF